MTTDEFDKKLEIIYEHFKHADTKERIKSALLLLVLSLPISVPLLILFIGGPPALFAALFYLIVLVVVIRILVFAFKHPRLALLAVFIGQL